MSTVLYFLYWLIVIFLTSLLGRIIADVVVHLRAWRAFWAVVINSPERLYSVQRIIYVAKVNKHAKVLKEQLASLEKFKGPEIENTRKLLKKLIDQLRVL